MPAKTLIIINDPPYGTERCYNALRLAIALPKADPSIELTIFLMADAVTAGKAGQKTPDGYYSIERMLKRVLANKGSVLMCGTCMDARGMAEGDVVSGARRSTKDELAAATVAADKVLVF
ncbi:MAG: DsrE/DsrF/TusD sulfur relay family protein [Allorhizobium sp.]